MVLMAVAVRFRMEDMTLGVEVLLLIGVFRPLVDTDPCGERLLK